VSCHRSEETVTSTEQRLSAVQQQVDSLAAENRVLAEGSRSMRQECNEAWVSTQNITIQNAYLFAYLFFLSTFETEIRYMAVPNATNQDGNMRSIQIGVLVQMFNAG